MRRDDNEIIDVFDADSAPFDADGVLGRGMSDDDTGHATGQRTVGRARWVVPAGVVALAAVVAIGVATGSDDGSRAATSSSTTASAPDSTTPFTLAPLPPPALPDTPAAADALPPTYAVALPTGYTGVQAYVQIDQTPTTPTLSQLWATPGSTATTGQWITVSAGRAIDPRDQQLESNAYRVVEDGITLLVTPAASAGTSARVDRRIADDWISVSGFGVDTATLLAIATSAVIDGQPTSPPSDVLSSFTFDTSRLPGFDLVVSRTGALWSADAAPGSTSSFYAMRGTGERSAFTETDWISVTVNVPLPAHAGYAAALPFVLADLRPFTAPDGSIGLAGRANNPLPGSFELPRATAQWIDANGWLVTVSMSGTVDDVIALAATAYRATYDEFITLDDHADDAYATAQNPQTTIGQHTTLALDDGTTLDVALQQLTSGDRRAYQWSLSLDLPSNGLGFTTGMVSGATATVSTLANRDRVVVLATVPADVVGATLAIIPADGTAATVVPFDDTFTAVEQHTAVAQVVDPGPFSAVVTAADGTVLASWRATPSG